MSHTCLVKYIMNCGSMASADLVVDMLAAVY